METLRLNLGCGHVQPSGWINADGSIRAWLATHLGWLDQIGVRLGLLPPTEFSRETVYVSLHKPLPWATASASCIYMGEVLEHFTRADGERLLAECRRVLAPGGVLRVRVPDHARFWRNYLTEYDAMRAKPKAEWSTAHTRWTEMFFRDICVRRPGLKSVGHYHKWMYDDVSLILTLEHVGFKQVERRAAWESAIADIRSVETRDDLIVEARR